MRLAINGFGRIGRQVLRIAWEDDALDIVHLNDLTDAPTLAHLLKYDSTYGIWNHDVQGGNGKLFIDGEEISVGSERDPSRLPWQSEQVDVVLESTGAFRKKEQAHQHIQAGAEKVLVSAPGKTPLDGDFVVGVNEAKYNPDRHHIISIGSCTTNCLAPLAKVLHEEFTIVRGLMTTSHGYTANQNLLDGPHKDLRRARSAAENVIPTTTGAAKAIGMVMPELEGKLDGMALRIPVPCGSILDLTCVVENSTSVDGVNDTVRRWSKERMRGVLEIADAPIVSRDIIGNPASSIFSPQDTFVMDGTLVKVLAWYDNEWGFSNRCVDMIKRML